jgi:hypothetical protein
MRFSWQRLMRRSTICARYSSASIARIAVATIAFILVAGCASSTSREADQTRTIAKEAYIYAYPMLYNYKTMYGQAIDPTSPAYVGGFNTFRHYSQPYTAANTEIVTPNNDTPYSWAWLDLRAEPIVLSVPAVPRQRYNVFQLVDLYTYNYAYVGVRATGFAAGNYLIAGPGWNGKPPPGITKVLKSETDIVAILGRTSMSGPADEKNVRALQARYRLRPLSAFLHRPAPAAAPAVQWIPWDEKKANTIDFIAYLNQLLLFAQPPNPGETAMMQRFATIGIGPGKPFDAAALAPSQRKAIEEGVADGKTALLVAQRSTRTSLGLFGTRDFLKDDYTKRAVAAAMGIYGNSQEEAIYLGYEEDAAGQRLNGATPYVIRFPKGQLPPATFFWSMTMYDLPGRHLVANPIDRYAIGDRTGGLKYNKDGSLDIYVQHDAPGAARKSNWLPAPAGPYNIVLRIYGPKPSALNGNWQLPQPVKAD